MTGRTSRLAMTLIAGMIVVLGCGGAKPSEEVAEGPGRGPLGAAVRSGSDIAVTDASGEIVMVIGNRDGKASVAWRDGANQVEAIAAISGQTTQYKAGETLISSVAGGDAGFEVSVGTRKWRISMAAGLISVDGGASQFIIKTQNENKFLIFSGGGQIGYLKYYPDQLKIKVKDMSENSLFKSNTTRVSAMYGMMMMPDIPPAARGTIMAEILRRNR